ncbi:histone deacetylase family protein [Portibacter lacus]|uniref:Histone deacetylase n=1 Tax=Portibacter lacus TaxID=1099794 RepID=A0AA37WD83_9BACT|nr:histone deacetylase [Portibacter lacus]GLR15642.1 histone deacetylase [Portibacter lacus]
MLKIAYSPVYKYELPKGHRFPMDKYELIPEQLLYEGSITTDQFFHPDQLSEADILLTHTNEYWQKLATNSLSKKEIRKIGFPVRPELIDRGRYIAKGTVDCVKYALEDGVSMNVAGGTHHAFADSGEGFCIFNDFAIAANYYLSRGVLQKILIVDLDVHQGNGTAKIFEEEPRVFTFSMHGEKNYPLRKEKSDLDIGVPDKIEDADYLKILKDTLPKLLDQVQPEIVFYLSGVDVLSTDKLGRLGMTKEGCKQRDQFVFESCYHENIPVVVSMGGGYSERIADIVDAHANTFRLAQEIWF